MFITFLSGMQANGRYATQHETSAHAKNEPLIRTQRGLRFATTMER